MCLHPLVFRHVFPGNCSQLADSWDSFVATDTLRYTTNEGVPTDRARGQSTHCRGPATLAEVRQQPLRIETDLGELTETNPVEAWLLQAPHNSVAKGVHRLLVQLSILSLKDAPASTPVRRPAFITGNILVGDPCQVHWDAYNSVAVVIQGCKTLYIATPSFSLRGADHSSRCISRFAWCLIMSPPVQEPNRAYALQRLCLLATVWALPTSTNEMFPAAQVVSPPPPMTSFM